MKIAAIFRCIALSLAAVGALAGQSDAQTASSGYELTTLATGLDAPISITVDDNYIYSGSNATGNVTRLNKDGSGATTLVTGLGQVWGLDTDATTLYIADPINHNVVAVPKGGGTTTTLVNGLNNTLSVVVDGTDLYLSEFANGAIYFAPMASNPFNVLKDVAVRVADIAVDGSYVYFTQPDQGKVQRILKDGTGPIEDIATSGINFAWGLELIGNDLYIADSGSGKVFKTAKDGSGPLLEIASGFSDARNISANNGDLYISDDGTDIIFRLSPAAIAGAGYTATTVASGLNEPVALAVDDTYLYSGSVSTGEVTRMGKDGSSPSVIVTGGDQFWGMDVDATTLYIADNVGDDVWGAPKGGGALTSLVSNLSNNLSVVADGANLFVGDLNTNAIYTVPKTGGSAQSVVAVSGSGAGLAADDTYLYIGQGGDGKVVRVLKDGSGSVDEIATGLSYVWGLTLVGNDLYIVDQVDGKVFRVAKSGGTLVEVASNFTEPRTIATDGVDVFVTDAGRNSIVKLARQPLTVSIPDVTSPYDQQVVIPLQITDTSNQGVVSFEAFIDYDGDLLTPISADLTGTLAAVDWSIQTNIEEGGQIDTYKIAMATDDEVLVGAGDLVNITFQVANVRVPSSSALTLSHVLINDGTPDNLKTNGSLTVTGATATISSLPATVFPRQTITIEVVDADADLDGIAGNDQVSVAVENTTTNDIVNLTLNEDGTTPGTFSGTFDTEYGAAAIVDLLLQAQAGEVIVATYSDALDAAGNGPADRTAQTTVIGGADGSVEITLVSQPGDPLYIQVIDADLNTSFSSAETVSVTVSNSRTLESFVVVLTEADIDDDVFFGSLATIPGASTATEMETAEEDVLTVTYDDVVTLVGDQQDRTDTNDVINPWGDADDNESLQAFDAAKVLLEVLFGNQLTPVGLRSANVDNQSVTSGINTFDASLILQKRVGLIASFPVQEPTSENNPQGTAASPKLLPEQRQLSLVTGDGYLSLYADVRDDLLSGDLLLRGIAGRVEMVGELANFMSASRQTEEGLRVVFAGAEAAAGPGELLRIHGVGPTSAQLVRAEFNNGGIAGQASALAAFATPATFALGENVPNPFNPTTTIHFELPQMTQVELVVFDILGQKVRRLVAEQLPAGAHSAVWDGRNEAGIRVGNGVYLYQLRAADFVEMKRMLLLK
jgi:hypothetical protein